MPDRTPLFLAKSSYRTRRLSEAARLVPVVGMFLLLLPAFWSAPGQGQTSLSGIGVYIFLIWAGLIVIAAAMARKLPRREAGPIPREDQA